MLFKYGSPPFLISESVGVNRIRHIAVIIRCGQRAHFKIEEHIDNADTPFFFKVIKSHYHLNVVIVIVHSTRVEGNGTGDHISSVVGSRCLSVNRGIIIIIESALLGFRSVYGKSGGVGYVAGMATIAATITTAISTLRSFFIMCSFLHKKYIGGISISYHIFSLFQGFFDI